MQCQFFKKIFGLPRCTPGYALRVEIGRILTSATIFTLILKWIAKLITRKKYTFPAIVFNDLLEANNKLDCISKYNWITIVN